MADNSRVIRTKTAQTRGAAHQQVSGHGTVQTEYRRRKETVAETAKQERVEAGFFPPGVEPALVRVSAGTTMNLGNFESMRIDVSITLPCRVEDVDETYLRCSEFVSEKIAEEESVWFPSDTKAGGKKAARR